MKKLSTKQIKRIKKLIKKMKMNQANIKSPIQPIYDDIYFEGLNYLEDKKDSNHE